MPDAVEHQRAVERGERLESDRRREEQRNLVEAQNSDEGNPRQIRMQGRVDQRTGQKRKRQAEGGADEQRGEPGEESGAIRPEIPGERQGFT